MPFEHLLYGMFPNINKIKVNSSVSAAIITGVLLIFR